jgi:hypothetical protein
MKSFIYGHIHPCRSIKITVTFKLYKFQAQALVHAQAILIDLGGMISKNQDAKQVGDLKNI